MNQQVGLGGNFLIEEQTLKPHEKEHWRPTFLNRDDPETWISKGSKTYQELVSQKAVEILESHEAEPLPKGVSWAFDEIAAKAEKTLAKKHLVSWNGLLRIARR